MVRYKIYYILDSIPFRKLYIYLLEAKKGINVVIYLFTCE